MAVSRHLRLYKRPEQKAVAIHGTKLIGPKGPVCAMDAPMNPPKATAKAPMYGPSIIPISGAMTAVTLMDVPMAPIIGNRDQKEKMVHKGAKTQTRAKFLVANLEFNVFLSPFFHPHFLPTFRITYKGALRVFDDAANSLVSSIL